MKNLHIFGRYRLANPGRPVGLNLALQVLILDLHRQQFVDGFRRLQPHHIDRGHWLDAGGALSQRLE